MRRTIGAAVLALGFFLLFLAPLARFYIADRLIVFPVNETTKLTSVGQNATYFDAAKVRMVTGANLTATTTLQGVPAKSTDDTGVWDYFSALEDTSAGAGIDYTTWRMAFDRRTAALKTCCTAAVERDTAVRQSGVGVLFPLADVQKKTYQRFDPVTGRAWPAVFQGEETVAGVKAYRFVQRVDATAIERIQGVPGSLLGMDAKKGYAADKVYSAIVTVWIDPRTGLTVDLRQQVTARLRTEDGVDRATVLSADMRFDEATRTARADRADESAGSITMVRVVLPVGALVAGAGLLVVGVVITRGRGRHRRPADNPPGSTEVFAKL
ncbi:DUF3068 domain-containing protein [Thermomonospora umbrina]|uniref:DUF3068 family protein n=1 Tax=Thermomonospora umbrina TaxID=111806 RepID=A0A3D9SWS7_9ACTN|nr:DUF3068 domain-containing protein [Thermomonospora umbrina]REE97024.1 DUF3068 family protein [Thermomonospora umbrina]